MPCDVVEAHQSTAMTATACMLDLPRVTTMRLFSLAQ